MNDEHPPAIPRRITAAIVIGIFTTGATLGWAAAAALLGGAQ